MVLPMIETLVALWLIEITVTFLSHIKYKIKKLHIFEKKGVHLPVFGVD